LIEPCRRREEAAEHTKDSQSRFTLSFELLLNPLPLLSLSVCLLLLASTSEPFAFCASCCCRLYEAFTAASTLSIRPCLIDSSAVCPLRVLRRSFVVASCQLDSSTSFPFLPPLLFLLTFAALASSKSVLVTSDRELRRDAADTAKQDGYNLGNDKYERDGEKRVCVKL
jgi:hypothetical protein